MEKVINVSNVEIPLSLHSGKVIHADKYSEAHGGAFSFPVSSTLHTDVVFRLDGTNVDLPVHIEGLDLPVYTGQSVTLVTSNNRVLAYIDDQTKYYYYTSRNFCKKLGIGIPLWWVWLFGIAGGVIIYFLQRTDPTFWVFVPILTFYVMYAIQKWITNSRIEKQIDAFLR